MFSFYSWEWKIKWNSLSVSPMTFPFTLVDFISLPSFDVPAYTLPFENRRKFLYPTPFSVQNLLFFEKMITSLRRLIIRNFWVRFFLPSSGKYFHFQQRYKLYCQSISVTHFPWKYNNEKGARRTGFSEIAISRFT